MIGADGVDSVVRRRLAPEGSVVSAGCTAWRAVIPWYRASELIELLDRMPTGGATGGETVGAGHRFRYAVMGSRGSAGGARRAAASTGRRPFPARPARNRRRRNSGCSAAGSPSGTRPISDLLAATEPDDLIQHPIGELWPIPRTFAYHAGRGGYALLGDAAHAMAHHLGQGACLALEDAAALGRGRSRASRPGPRCTPLWTATRRPGVRSVVRIGRQSRRVGAVLTVIACAVADPGRGARPRAGPAGSRYACIAAAPPLLIAATRVQFDMVSLIAICGVTCR